MPRLNKELGLWQGTGLLMTSLLGTGIFVVPATAATLAGLGSLWAWSLLIFLVLPIAFTFARLGRIYPHSGGAPHLIGRAFGGGAERFAAFLFLAVLPVGLPAALNMAAGFWHAVLPLTTTGQWWIQIATLGGVLVIGCRGAGASGRVQMAIALLIMLVTLLIIFSSSLRMDDLVAPRPVAGNWLKVGDALAVMFWCFVGLEAFAHMGEEFHRPDRDYPLALLLGVVLAGAIYYLHSVVVLKAGVYGDERLNGMAIPQLLAQQYGEPALWLAALLGYLSCFASINIYLQGFARLLWSMAEEGKLPSGLAVRSRRGAPVRALLCVLAVCALAVSLGSHWQLSLATLIRYANGNFVLIYLFCMVAGWRLLSGVWRWLALLSALLCALVLCTLGQSLLYALTLGGLYGGVGLLWRCADRGCLAERRQKSAASDSSLSQSGR
ncbi:L-methionine/branched-chain amino acid transporter [Pseudaeromonas sharmana]|uniref:L-methionine/branched-chain amino acid transporter n=1 Tax=Pseudaeromonas sharmana TaxID=328412 RepID=A0ABV8CRC4_9GAMM